MKLSTSALPAPLGRACPPTAVPRARAVQAGACRLLGALLASLWLVGCASAPPAGLTTAQLLHDGLFRPPAERVDPAQALALSAPMRRFADEVLSATHRPRDPRQALLAALRARDQLQLDYDDGRTRNAAEAFDKRAGNCLSLVLMTAAFARHLDLPLRYQSVQVRPQYSRDHELTLVAGHVNLVLATRQLSPVRDAGPADELTVDFVPPSDLRGVRVRPLAEATVLAMYTNNRAAESLAAGRNDEAYAWARESVLLDPAYLPGINTLAVVYLRAGHLAEAESALQHVLATAPEDEGALSNLVVTLQRDGRHAQAAAAAERLARVQPYPPFHFLDLGRLALQEGRLDQARELIQRELRRQPFQHEAHFWAAMVDVQLGDTPAAEKHLRLAAEHGGSPQQQARYSAKLAALRAPDGR